MSRTARASPSSTGASASRASTSSSAFARSMKPRTSAPCSRSCSAARRSSLCTFAIRRAPAGEAEDVEVVVARLDRPAQQRVEREPRGQRALGGEAVAEGGEPLAVARRQALGERSGPPEGRPAPERRPRSGVRANAASIVLHARPRPGLGDEGERVGRRADERGGEDAEERLLVARVRERREPRAEVADDLAAPVAAAAGGHRLEAGVLERALVDGQVAGRPDEHDDLLGPRPRPRRRARASAGRRAAPPRGATAARAGSAPRSTSSQPVVPVMSSSTRGARLRRRLDARHERREALPHPLRERRVDDVEDLRMRAEVDGQRERAAGLGEAGAAGAEDADVRVAEAVDRLQLVADHELRRAGEEVEELDLERVGVLELVDEHPLEALAQRVADARRVAEQVAGQQLEVVEVERRPRALARRVRAAVARQEVVELGERRARPVTRARVGERLARLEVRRDGGALQRLRAARLERGLPERLRPRQVAGVEHLAAARRSRRAPSRPSRPRRPRAPPPRPRRPRRSGSGSGAGAGATAGRRGAVSPAERSASWTSTTATRSRSAVNAAATSSAGSPRSSSQAENARSHAASRSARALGSSRTANPGSSPAVTAWPRSSRAQNPWTVEIQAPSASRAASRARRAEAGSTAASRSASSSSRSRTRCFISPAAFSVKVIARIRPGETPSSSTWRTNRSTRTEVLPLPAAALRRRSPSASRTARACSSVNARPRGPRRGAMSRVTRWPRSGRWSGRRSRRPTRRCPAAARARPSGPRAPRRAPRRSPRRSARRAPRACGGRGRRSRGRGRRPRAARRAGAGPPRRAAGRARRRARGRAGAAPRARRPRAGSGARRSTARRASPSCPCSRRRRPRRRGRRAGRSCRRSATPSPMSRPLKRSSKRVGTNVDPDRAAAST